MERPRQPGHDLVPDAAQTMEAAAGTHVPWSLSTMEGALPLSLEASREPEGKMADRPFNQRQSM